MIKIVCKLCGKIRYVVPSQKNTAKYCSRKCQSKNSEREKHWNWKGGDVKLNCENCGLTFSVERSRKHTAKFCSRKCLGKHFSIIKRGKNNPCWKKKIILFCNECGKKIKVNEWDKQRKYCSRKCFGIGHSKYLQDNHPFKGEHHTKKTIEKLKEKRARQVFPKKDSSIEVKVQEFLKVLGIEFFTHQYMKINHGYQCDVLIPSMNLVIECDGDYWHKYPIGRDIDHVRTKELIEEGFKVLRLWGSEIRVMVINQFKEKVGI